MIVELTRTDDTRQYCSPVGGLTTACEYLRLDCTEVWYTKYRAKTEDELRAILPKVETASELVVLPHDTDREWIEGLYVRYRGVGDLMPRAVLAIGYTITIYQDPPRRDQQLTAELGPKETK